MLSFLKSGLEDLCVSRTSFTWGIPVEFDPKHVVYVWMDALFNYATALGFMSEDESNYKKYWPADVHLVGKDILRFHTIIWPAMLIALDQPLPKQVFGHGWLLIGNGEKMSKSKGNVIDPIKLVERYGVDAIRFFLLREIAFGQDGNFTNESLIQRINTDLANDLGNLLSRTVAMVEKYFGGVLPEKTEATEFDADLIRVAKETVQNTENYMDKFLLSDATAEIWNLIRRCNKYIDETAPWILAKDESKKAVLAGVMYNLVEALRIVSVLISPIMPKTPALMREQLGIKEGELTSWESIQTWGALPKGTKVSKGEIIFPRIDMDKELAELEAANKPAAEEKKEEIKQEAKKELITIDDFDKLELKIGEVIQCEKIEKSDKLLKSQIKIGNEVRQIVSGIAKWYTPEEMVGKKVVVVTNLKPVKLRGVMSEGMVLAADDGKGNLALLTANIENGANVG